MFLAQRLADYWKVNGVLLPEEQLLYPSIFRFHSLGLYLNSSGVTLFFSNQLFIILEQILPSETVPLLCPLTNMFWGGKKITTVMVENGRK